MSSSLRFAIIAGLLAAVGGGVALVNRSGPPAAKPTQAPTGAPTNAGCLQTIPRRIATPAWYPADLPLLAGTYAIEVPPVTGTTRRAIFVVDGTLRDFVTYALDRWPKDGWQLGRGESEPGEAEDQFAKPSEGRYGAFRIRSIFCDQTKSWLLVVLGKRTVTASPSSSPG